MSLIVEIAGMAGGMLSEYARKKRWSKPRSFFMTFFTFFFIFSTYVLLFPSEKGILVGIMAAIILGLSMGTALVFLINIHDRIRKPDIKHPDSSDQPGK